MYPRLTRTLLAALCLCGLGACSSMPSASDSLYQQLGGKAGISKTVTIFLYQVVDDDRINHYFAGVNADRLQKRLTNQFCQLSGGPCHYGGDNMHKVHAGMHLTDADFNALVEDLILAMEKRRVPISAQNRLLGKLAPMHAQIVGK